MKQTIILTVGKAMKQTYKKEDNGGGISDLHSRIQEGLYPWLMNLGFCEGPLKGSL